MTENTEQGAGTRPGGERTYWLDKPANVDKLIRWFFLSCAVLIAIDFLVPKQGPFEIEHMWGFYGIFGFFACVALVLIAKQMRKVVMRSEDYYDR